MSKHIFMPELAFAGAGGEVLPPRAQKSFMNNVMFYGPGPGGPGGGPGGPGPGGPGGPGGPYGHGPGPGGPGGPFGSGPGMPGGSYGPGPSPNGRSVFGRLYHGPHDPGLPGGGYISLDGRGKGRTPGEKETPRRKLSPFARLRDWWYFHTHEL